MSDDRETIRAECPWCPDAHEFTLPKGSRPNPGDDAPAIKLLYYCPNTSPPNNGVTLTIAWILMGGHPVDVFVDRNHLNNQQGAEYEAILIDVAPAKGE